MTIIEAPGRFGRPPKNRKSSAKRLRLTEITAIGSHLIGVNTIGSLFRWDADRSRWERLEPVVMGIEARAKALRRSEINSACAQARWSR